MLSAVSWTDFSQDLWLKSKPDCSDWPVAAQGTESECWSPFETLALRPVSFSLRESVEELKSSGRLDRCLGIGRPGAARP